MKFAINESKVFENEEEFNYSLYDAFERKDNAFIINLY